MPSSNVADRPPVAGPAAPKTAGGAPAAGGAAVAAGAGSAGAVAARRRARRASATRTYFLRAISAQLNGARILAIIAVVVLLAGGAYWLAGTTGSPVVGIYFLVLGTVLVFTVYWFVQVMRMFTGRR